MFAAVLAALIGISGSVHTAPARASNVDVLQNFDGAAGWLNGAPLALSDLRGKVVLVDFWEYTCINCLRTLPYLKAWYARYHDEGFEIVGVHSPEFGFSGDRSNVAAAAARLGVTWPIALDDAHTIWLRYGVSSWPTEELFDQDGKLVDTQVGEGNYPQTEAKIQSLLISKKPDLHLPPVMALLPQDSYDKPGSVCYPQTPETYVGPWHGQMIANAGPFNDPSTDSEYQDPGPPHREGAVFLKGYWHATKDSQAMASGDGDSSLALNYKAIQVLAVMKADSGGSTRVNVTQDGKPIARTDAGPDIRFDASGLSYVDVDTARAYELLDNAHFGQHELRLMPQRYGLGIYSFAFESCEVGSDTSQ
jgi:thiol-disulfide isomerase/thioredoxin